MKILYFSWVRESVGISCEDYKTDAKTVNDLVQELMKKEDRYRIAFKRLDLIRVAVDKKLVDDFEADLAGVSEIAFFPPMTGG